MTSAPSIQARPTNSPNIPLSNSSRATLPAPISTEARDFLERPWDVNSLEQGVQFVKDRKKSVSERQLILDRIRGSRRKMDANQLRRFRSEVASLAKDPQEDPALAAQAIGAMTSLNLLMAEKGEITLAQAKQDAPFLIDVAKDPKRDRDMRGRAIRALTDLKVTEAVPVLQGMLADPSNDNIPEVARNGSIALARLNPENALLPIVRVMSHTSDRSVFGSAAFALGQLRTPESMAALVKLKDRFPDSDSCQTALGGMDEVIFAVLKNPQDPNLVEAIRAAGGLWNKSQRERAVPLLRALLRLAPPAARAESTDQLIKMAEMLDFQSGNRELEAILALINDQTVLTGYADRIRQRLEAKPLVIMDQGIPVPSTPELDPK